MRAFERLLNYVKVHTTSDSAAAAAGRLPSTDRQFDLARLLEKEMKELGLSDVHTDENCYVYGFIPATPGYEERPCIGFIAHLDTSPECSGENVRPLIHENYDGEDIVLPGGRVIETKLYPHLLQMKGKTLITSDGTTLLGADDKAGIAEILTMAEQVIRKEIPHGRIAIAFTPDEEIGGGADHLDIPYFGADYAYTVDGDDEEEIEYENFNAAAARFRITGRSVHPGEAKGKMVSAALLAVRINSMLPAAEAPMYTEGREGFYHLTGISGHVESAEVSYIIRDHSRELFAARKATLEMIAKTLNEMYGEGTVSLTIQDQYENMLEMIRPCMHLIENAQKVMMQLGRTPAIIPVRGGTDGAQLSFRGLPCPNLGTGGHAFHGPYEHICAESMDFVTQLLCGIVSEYASSGLTHVER